MSAVAPTSANVDALLFEALKRKELLDRRVKELEESSRDNPPGTYDVPSATETNVASLWQEWEAERGLLQEQMRLELQASNEARNNVFNCLAQIEIALSEEDKRQEEMREKFAKQWAQEREAMLREHESMFQGLQSARSSLTAQVAYLEEKTGGAHKNLPAISNTAPRPIYLGNSSHHKPLVDLEASAAFPSHPENSMLRPGSPCPRTPRLPGSPCPRAPRLVAELRQPRPRQGLDGGIQAIQQAEFVIQNVVRPMPSTFGIDGAHQGEARTDLLTPSSPSHVPRSFAAGVADSSLVAPLLSPARSPRSVGTKIADGSLVAPVLSPKSAARAPSLPADQCESDPIHQSSSSLPECAHEPVKDQVDFGTPPKDPEPVALPQTERSKESAAEREMPMQVGFEVLKPVSEVHRWEDPNSSRSLMALQWNTKDGEHATIGRVELQLWDVNKDSVLKQLQDNNAHSFQGVRLKGSLVAFSQGFQIRFSPAIHSEVSPSLKANELLSQDIFPAHLGCGSSPALITIDNLPMLTPLVLRLRLHSGIICGPWGEPLLLMILPDGDSTSCSAPRSDTLLCALILGLSSPVPAVTSGSIRAKARAGTYL
eukprot:gnl/MRDRNA2_/MRDRNA2_118033_c0_seq1.p1 gnl/MRDRNA2_/MRDRNA2_118033_c0~~gnl/MRDRNA2_/MRDRNA2_118033_c0_seq1.p1  ORF type:complete len:599 (+),score=101.25 gnl/MRDRNA2_/MRDRNA2_118033_c0_seq1:56-1852(+)